MRCILSFILLTAWVAIGQSLTQQLQQQQVAFSTALNLDLPQLTKSIVKSTLCTYYEKSVENVMANLSQHIVHSAPTLLMASSHYKVQERSKCYFQFH